jgi:hypothetical protein
MQSLMLLNVTGQAVIVKTDLNSKQEQLDTEGLKPGIYFLRIQRDGEWIHQKIVKE